jgi:hypothetical protein
MSTLILILVLFVVGCVVCFVVGGAVQARRDGRLGDYLLDVLLISFLCDLFD